MCNGKFFYSGFLLFLGQQGAHKYCSLTKNQERTTLSSTACNRQRAWVKRKDVHVCKSNVVTRWRELVGTYFHHEHFSAKYRYGGGGGGGGFEGRFQPLSLGEFLPNQRDSICRRSKSPFPSKGENSQLAYAYSPEKNNQIRRTRVKTNFFGSSLEICPWRVFYLQKGREICRILRSRVFEAADWNSMIVTCIPFFELTFKGIYLRIKSCELQAMPSRA